MLSSGNAITASTTILSKGALQPDGRIVPEATFDCKYVGDSIVHIASLPRNVAVLEFNIMYVSPGSFKMKIPFFNVSRFFFLGLQLPRSSDEVDALTESCQALTHALSQSRHHRSN
jgi:hypothetical protein